MCTPEEKTAEYPAGWLCCVCTVVNDHALKRCAQCSQRRDHSTDEVRGDLSAAMDAMFIPRGAEPEDPAWSSLLARCTEAARRRGADQIHAQYLGYDCALSLWDSRGDGSVGDEEIHLQLSREVENQAWNRSVIP